ncbi:hypothetical protein [Thiohalomonas denitrificans]|uniref:hypothetical protein n=1 Tax=Thiohalomonas denitrificans TaxID=415747 RepID=UPI0026EA6881|nr:hypothetical protein [Thiohalomonas denitrificans]
MLVIERLKRPNSTPWLAESVFGSETAPLAAAENGQKPFMQSRLMLESRDPARSLPENRLTYSPQMTEKSDSIGLALVTVAVLGQAPGSD